MRPIHLATRRRGIYTPRYFIPSPDLHFDGASVAFPAASLSWGGGWGAGEAAGGRLGWPCGWVWGGESRPQSLGPKWEGEGDAGRVIHMAGGCLGVGKGRAVPRGASQQETPSSWGSCPSCVPSTQILCQVFHPTPQSL